MKTSLLKGLVVVSAIAGVSTAFAQLPPTDPPPADFAWNKTVDSDPVPRYYQSTLLAGPVTPNTYFTHAFPVKYKCWETVSDPASSSPSWTAAYSALFDNVSSQSVGATSDSGGNIIWHADWNDTTADGGGTPGVQRWVQLVTGAVRERKLHWKYIEP